MKSKLQTNNYITQEVGILRGDIIEKLGLVVQDRRIVLYPGTIKHMKRRHYRAYHSYFSLLPDIIQSPDYIGMSASDQKCIEFVKKYEEYIMVAVKWDQHGQLFISSMYVVEDNRVDNRIIYGKLIEVPKVLSRKEQKYKNAGKRYRRR